MLEIEVKGAVRILRMNNGKDNRFNTEFVEALNQELDKIEADPGARAVVVTAALCSSFRPVRSSSPPIRQLYSTVTLLARFRG